MIGVSSRRPLHFHFIGQTVGIIVSSVIDFVHLTWHHQANYTTASSTWASTHRHNCPKEGMVIFRRHSPHPFARGLRVAKPQVSVHI
mmetsp:Transcript_26287/g.35454  ORF Transcript_26287/g.35454 Transcript_26287/m.35454 type:complete len:87 (+) Transcript_26287:3-263(+)